MAFLFQPEFLLDRANVPYFEPGLWQTRITNISCCLTVASSTDIDSYSTGIDSYSIESYLKINIASFLRKEFMFGLKVMLVQ